MFNSANAIILEHYRLYYRGVTAVEYGHFFVKITSNPNTGVWKEVSREVYDLVFDFFEFCEDLEEMIEFGDEVKSKSAGKLYDSIINRLRVAVDHNDVNVQF